MLSRVSTRFVSGGLRNWSRMSYLSKLFSNIGETEESDSTTLTEAANYYNSRSQSAQDWVRNDPTRSYPHKWVTNMSIFQVLESYSAKNLEKGQYLEEQVHTAGRVVSIRKAGANLLFLDVSSNGANLQVIASSQSLGGKENISRVDTEIKRGDIVGVSGKPGRSKTNELSIFASEIQLLSPCLHMLPKERTGIKDIDVRFRQRYLDLLINKGVREKFITRRKVLSFLRSYLDERGFLEIETPILSLLSGGAAAKPFKTYHNDLGTELFMRVAPELYHKQLIVGGFEKVYEIGKNFRNEGIDYNHNPEFTACEFYWAYADYEDVMSLTEDLLRKMVQHVCGSTKVMVKTRHDQKVTEVDFSQSWRRVSIMEELEKILDVKFPSNLESDEAYTMIDNLCKKNNIDCSHPRTTARLIDKLVGALIEPSCIAPTFLMDHPQLMSPLAKPHRSKPGLTERFELFISQFEIVNAYTELNDPFFQRRMFEAQAAEKDKGDDEAQPFDHDFIKALEHGLPPTAGFGIGLDRLIMLLTGADSIQEVILFPAMRPRQITST